MPLIKVRVKNLPDQLGSSGPRAFLYCTECQGDYSAHRGDYFQLDPDHVMTCCGQPMLLVTAKRVLTPVKVGRI